MFRPHFVLSDSGGRSYQQSFGNELGMTGTHRRIRSSGDHVPKLKAWESCGPQMKLFIRRPRAKLAAWYDELGIGIPISRAHAKLDMFPVMDISIAVRT